jgi:hypothetical protein
MARTPAWKVIKIRGTFDQPHRRTMAAGKCLSHCTTFGAFQAICAGRFGNGRNVLTKTEVMDRWFAAEVFRDAVLDVPTSPTFQPCAVRS